MRLESRRWLPSARDGMGGPPLRRHGLHRLGKSENRCPAALKAGRDWTGCHLSPFGGLFPGSFRPIE